MGEQSEYRKLEHLPYISLIIRSTNDSNPSDKRFQELFLSTSAAKKYFVVKFGENNDEIKGVMHSILPSFVILRIYTKNHWMCPSAAINEKLKHLRLDEPDLNENDRQKIQKICDSNLQIGGD